MIKIRSAALIEAYSKIRPFEGVLKFLFFELKIKQSNYLRVSSSKDNNI